MDVVRRLGEAIWRGEQPRTAAYDVARGIRALAHSAGRCCARYVWGRSIRLADRPLSRPPVIRGHERTRAPIATFALWVGRVLPWLAPPAICALALAGVGATAAGWGKAPTDVSLAEGLAALALLATVNVFTVQLWASRLPGVVARSAAQPWQLFFSYSAVLSLLGLVIFGPGAGRLKRVDGWMVLTALMLFIGGLLAAMFLFLRRADAGRAAGGYVAAALPGARAAGRRVGRLQARALEMVDALRSVPMVTAAPDLIAGEWRVDIYAPSRGLFSPSRTNLRRLLADAAFSARMRLRLFAGLSTIVRAGEHLASLVPGREQSVTPALQRRATRRLRTRSSRGVEEVSTGAVALVQLALDLARTGDTGTAHSVARHAVRLVTQHTAAARGARKGALRRQAQRSRAAAPPEFRSRARPANADAQARDTQLAPVVPALREVLRMTVRRQLDSPDGFFDIPAALVVPLLATTGEAEAAVSILTFAVPVNGDGENDDPGRRAELLRLGGVRALELGASVPFELLLDQLDRLSRHESSAVDAVMVTSVLAATACRFDARLSRRATDHVLAETVGRSADADRAAAQRVGALWRVGAAALSSGTFSVAVHVATALYERSEEQVVITAAVDEDVMTAEAARSAVTRLRGRPVLPLDRRQMGHRRVRHTHPTVHHRPLATSSDPARISSSPPRLPSATAPAALVVPG